MINLITNHINGVISRGTRVSALVLINEQHTLLEEQQLILAKEFGDEMTFISIPANGWNEEEMNGVSDVLTDMLYTSMEESISIIFVSPVPKLIVDTAYSDGRANHFSGSRVSVFHNDSRVKKELPNGKVIYTVAQTGWKLV